MVAEIRKLEAAARVAMGNFEAHDTAVAKRRFRVPHPLHALLVLAVVIGLAAALL